MRPCVKSEDSNPWPYPTMKNITIYTMWMKELICFKSLAKFAYMQCGHTTL